RTGRCDPGSFLTRRLSSLRGAGALLDDHADIGAGGVLSAVQRNILAGEVGGTIRAEKSSEHADIPGLCEPIAGDGTAAPGYRRGPLARPIVRRSDRAGRDRIDGNPTLSHLHRERSAE